MIKKIIVLLAIILCAVFSLSICSSASNEISLVINNTKVECEVPPIISNDRTLVPVRVLFEYYDAKVSWNESLRQVMVISGTTVMIFNIDSKIMYLNGAVHTLDAAPVIVNDRTLVPVRFISENLGYIVKWDGLSRTVSVSKPKETSSSVSTTKPVESNKDNVNSNLVKLSSIRIGEKDDNCEITVVLSKKVTPKVMTLSDPHRLIFDFYGTNCLVADGNEKTESDVFSEVRWASHEEFTRIVVETKEECKYQISYISEKNCKITVTSGNDNKNDSGKNPGDEENSGKENNTSSSAEKEKPKIVYSGTPVVVIDPGHGGYDPGAVGTDENGNEVLYEKDVCLDISSRINNILTQNGVDVIMTRTTDVAFGEDELNDLLARCDIANNSGACLFVSIHNNAFTNSKANGVCVLYSGLESASDYGITGKQLAQNIQDELVDATGLYDRGIVESPGIVVLKKTVMPAVLVECAFITCPTDRAHLESPTGKQKIAQAISDAIISSLKQMGALRK